MVVAECMFGEGGPVELALSESALTGLVAWLEAAPRRTPGLDPLNPANSRESLMIEKILPAGVAFAECFTDTQDAMLFPEEEALVARAVEKRRREFTTARACARGALRSLGVPPVPILADERGAPQWPSGIVGSITHCTGYCAAAVAHSRDFLTIGIDAEPNDVLPDGVLDMVSLGRERGRLMDLTATAPGICWDRLLFSAKEAIYKAWYLLTRHWLGFEEAEVTIDAEDGTFDVRLLVPATDVTNSLPTDFAGHWLAYDGLVAAAIALPRRVSARAPRLAG
jgi:4'-phosphopantetheinyl transferase EntD